MGFVTRLYTFDLKNLAIHFENAKVNPLGWLSKELWWAWRGCRFVYCITLSAVSIVVSMVAMKSRSKLFWWAVVDYHFIGMWFGAFAALWTGTNGSPQGIASGEREDSAEGCFNCLWLRVAWIFCSLSACSWLLSFIIVVHYYRKTEKAA